MLDAHLDHFYNASFRRPDTQGVELLHAMEDAGMILDVIHLAGESFSKTSPLCARA